MGDNDFVMGIILHLEELNTIRKVCSQSKAEGWQSFHDGPICAGVDWEG